MGCGATRKIRWENKGEQLRGGSIWAFMIFGPAWSLTMGQVEADGIATMCEPIVATSISTEKTIQAMCLEWEATLENHKAVEKNKQMENTATWLGKNIGWFGRKRAAVLPKGRGGTTSALERNSAGSIVMVKTLDEILRASKRRVNVGCGACELREMRFSKV